jgi:tRNA threonylcarbamoyladenosine biosynthesis protein TsaB
MILYINTSKTDLIEVKLILDNKIIKESISHENLRQSELLLKMIDKVVSNLKKLKAIYVVSGPGAFSALRIGVSTANALAWSLHIPVMELEADQDISQVKILKEFKSVVPKYGKEPNITIAKK